MPPYGGEFGTKHACTNRSKPSCPRCTYEYRVKLKLGPRHHLGELVPAEEDGWKLSLFGEDWAVWEKL